MWSAPWSINQSIKQSIFNLYARNPSGLFGEAAALQMANRLDTKWNNTIQ